MRPARIEVHIEELVLHGFVPGDRYRLSEAVERELARLISEQGVVPAFTQNVEDARIDAGAFTVAPGSSSEAVGAQIAQALLGGFQQ